jgi:peptidoglycan/xylan/chitin deacetylase (PgdA/CDA1 family)
MGGGFFRKISFLLGWLAAAGLLIFSSGCQGGIFRIPTQEKIVALTFDDGPDPVFTPQVLKILDQFQVKATFFLLGSQAEAYPDLVRQIKARGHSLGNHSFNHDASLSFRSREESRREILKAQEVLYRITGEYPSLFRPPLGWVSEDVIAVCNELNLPIINGSVKASDVALPGVDYIVSAVVDYLRPGDIIILHDGGGFGFFKNRSQTLQALPIILEKLRGRGYDFVTVPVLLSQTSPHR